MMAQQGSTTLSAAARQQRHRERLRQAPERREEVLQRDRLRKLCTRIASGARLRVSSVTEMLHHIRGQAVATDLHEAASLPDPSTRCAFLVQVFLSYSRDSAIIARALEALSLLPDEAVIDVICALRDTRYQPPRLSREHFASCFSAPPPQGLAAIRQATMVTCNEDPAAVGDGLSVLAAFYRTAPLYLTQAAREAQQFEPLSILTDVLQLLPRHARDSYVTVCACTFAAEVILAAPHAFQSTYRLPAACCTPNFLADLPPGPLMPSLGFFSHLDCHLCHTITSVIHMFPEDVVVLESASRVISAIAITPSSTQKRTSKLIIRPAAAILQRACALARHQQEDSGVVDALVSATEWLLREP